MSAEIINNIMNHHITAKIIKDPRSTFGIACAGALISSQSLILGVIVLVPMGVIIFMAPNWKDIKPKQKAAPAPDKESEEPGVKETSADNKKETEKSKET